MTPSSPAYGRVPPPSTDPKSSAVSRAPWKSASQPLRNSRRCRQVVRYGRCARSSLVSPNGCEWAPVFVKPLSPAFATERVSSSPLLFFRDYYAALLRTHQSFVAPTQGKLLNYVQRVPLGVVAQITVRPLSRRKGYYQTIKHSYYQKLAVQSSIAHRDQENCPSSGSWKLRHCETLRGNATLEVHVPSTIVISHATAAGAYFCAGICTDRTRCGR